jgi:hypothetical protein
MEALFVAGWFVCGILGTYIAFRIEKLPGEAVWLALFGPIILIVSLAAAVEKAVREE